MQLFNIVTLVLIILLYSISGIGQSDLNEKDNGRIHIQFFDVETKLKIVPAELKLVNEIEEAFEVNKLTLNRNERGLPLEAKKGTYSYKVRGLGYKENSGKLVINKQDQLYRIYLEPKNLNSKVSPGQRSSLILSDKVLVHGYITDYDGAALSKVSVYFNGQLKAASDENGYYQYYFESSSKTDSGNTYSFKKEGFESYEDEVGYVRNGGFLNYTIHLKSVRDKVDFENLNYRTLNQLENIKVPIKKSGSDGFPNTIAVGSNCSGVAYNCSSINIVPMNEYVMKVLSKEWVQV